MRILGCIGLRISGYIGLRILGYIGVRISCSWGGDFHFQILISHRLHLPKNSPWFPQELPSLSLSALNLLPDKSSDAAGLSWDQGTLSWAEQNVLRWAFPFGCPARPHLFSFWRGAFCKGCKSNLRLLRLFLLCAVGKGESIDLCKQRGNELRDAPLTPLPLFAAGYPPVISASILSLWVFSCLISKWKKINGAAGSVPGELMPLPGRFSLVLSKCYWLT